MAYRFGAANADRIDCGAAVPHADQIFSLWIRFKLAVGGSGLRMICSYRDTNINFQLYTLATALVLNITQGGVPQGAGWTIAEDTEYKIGCVFVNAANLLLIYEGTDSSPKTSSSTPFAGVDIESTQHFIIGNYLGATDGSIHGDIYEVGWWPGTQLSGAELAAMGAGVPPSTDPSNYWPLVSDAVALFGGIDGTVTGASVVAHVGTNLYAGAPPSSGAARRLTQGIPLRSLVGGGLVG